MLEPLGDAALAAARPLAGERAVDIGCGCGATTIALAERVGANGRVLGIDISEPMLERARERCATLGLTNMGLLHAAAPSTSARSARATISRSRASASCSSKTPLPRSTTSVAACARTGGSRSCAGRTAIAIRGWASPSRQRCSMFPLCRLRSPVHPDHGPSPTPTASPASWPPPGWDASIEPVEHDLLVGGAADLDGAVAFAIDSGSMRSVLGDIDEDTRRRVADDLRLTFEAYVTSDGVRIPSATWVVERGTGGLVTETHVHRRQRVMGALVGAIAGDALAAPFAAQPPGAYTTPVPAARADRTRRDARWRAVDRAHPDDVAGGRVADRNRSSVPRSRSTAGRRR